MHYVQRMRSARSVCKANSFLYFTIERICGILFKSSRSGGMADALASGASGSNIVWVQVPSSALKKYLGKMPRFFSCRGAHPLVSINFKLTDFDRESIINI